MSNTLQEAWDEVEPDPDPAKDLGYEHAPLTVVEADEHGEKYIFLPREEEHLLDTEFIIAGPDSVRPLDNWR